MKNYIHQSTVFFGRPKKLTAGMALVHKDGHTTFIKGVSDDPDSPIRKEFENSEIDRFYFKSEELADKYVEEVYDTN